MGLWRFWSLDFVYLITIACFSLIVNFLTLPIQNNCVQSEGVWAFSMLCAVMPLLAICFNATGQTKPRWMRKRGGS